MKTLLLSTLIHLLPSWTEPTPLMIFKTAHSGSSWFTSLLNRYEGVYVTEEIVGTGKSNRGKFVDESPGEMTAYILNSLQHPMWKWPNGEDITQRNKTFFIVGCTLNPMKSFADLNKIARLVPSLRVVAYFRTNIVKHVTSSFRANHLKRECGHVVIKDECKLETWTTVELEKFDEKLIRVMAADLYIWKVVNSLSQTSFRVVFYEDLIGLKDEVEELLWWLGLDITDLEYTDDFNGRCYPNCTKTTSDDLRDSIANYEEVESFINTRYPCLSSQLYETRPGKVQPFTYNVCGDLFRSRVDSLLKDHHTI